MADVQVVTVAYNPGEELAEMAASLAAAAPQLDLTFHIVDNGTETEIVDRVAADYGAIVHRTGDNLGYGRGAHVALANPDATWSLLLNPDTVLHPDAITNLVAATARWKRGGLFGPTLVTDGEVYPSARALPSFSTGIGHALLSPVWPTNPWTRAYHGQPDEEQSVGWLSGAALLINPAAYAQVGGFSDRYFMFFEDVDIAHRMAEAGWQSVYVPSSVMEHAQGSSWKDRPAPMIKAHHASAATYLKQAYPSPLYAPLRAAASLGLKARATLLSRSQK